MKTIGLIGGMSWESTRIYYDLINRQVQQRLGGLHSARIILSSLDMAPIASMQSHGRWADAAAVLATEAARIEQAGADIVSLATNTMHKCAASIISAIRIPFLHIVDPLIARLHSDGRQRPLLLATRFTMEDRFFLDRLEAAGLEPMVPMQADRAALNKIIFEELCAGIVTAASAETVRQMAMNAASNGADSAILGCTEICMLVNPGILGLPVYDTTAIHAAALVDFSLFPKVSSP